MEKKGAKMKVECSPRTFQRIQTDEEYRNAVTQHVIESQGEDFTPIDEIVVAEVTGDTGNLEVHPENDPAKQVWLEAPIKLMLSLVEELSPRVGKSVKLKNKKKMWQRISEQLLEAGYDFSELQVQSKYRSMERQYKKTKLHNSKTERNRQICPYESELDKILGEKRGLYPDFVLDNEEIDCISRETMLENAGISPADENYLEDQLSTSGAFPVTEEESCSPASSVVKVRRLKVTSFQEKILQRVDALRHEREEYHSKIVTFLQNKEDREKARDERAQRKLTLLENIAASLKKD